MTSGRERRGCLEDVVAGSDLVFPVGRLAPDGLEAWKQVIERGYEGYVAKDEASAYEGGTARRWLKVKQKGWTPRRTADSGEPPTHPSAETEAGVGNHECLC